ncbi:MAG: 16S rRNA (cytidine(1402)-2'-O)-methyltransferase [Proteobacteria bacterium]|nr:16S rRNA (cytidine(1402)-2'-O)-methyltransferase [Pseudomonadota bacterium]
MVKNSASLDGILYIVATPIGNRDDISLRALDTLKSVDKILAEDTRHSKVFLESLGIQKPLISLHAHNESTKSKDLIELLLSGQNLALISDAGTPLISDPGFPLVRLAREKGINVVPIPGPSAIITALSAAGVPADNFTFIGFLPAKQQARKERLKELAKALNTVVLYESTHRILNCLEDIEAIFGPDYELVLAKELTKTFERFIQDKVSNIRQLLSDDAGLCKGEFVLILPAKLAEEGADLKAKDTLLILLEELPLKQAVKIAHLLTKVNKNELYQLALELKSK